MSDFFNTGYSQLHLANLLIHIMAGAVAICLGGLQYFSEKGSRRHILIGRTYIGFFIVVLLTAVFGMFIFGFRAYLAALTLSAGYGILSAIRVLKIKETGPCSVDNLLSIAFGSTAIGMMIFTSVPPQETVVIFRIALGALIAICFYDLARNLKGKAWLERSWLNEHIYKMVGSHSALMSAAAGNMLRDWQPWSILAPTFGCMLLIVCFILRHPLPIKRKTL